MGQAVSLCIGGNVPSFANAAPILPLDTILRWERGIPTQSQGVLSNGAKTDREKIKEMGGIKRCLCLEFLQRGSFVHVLQWMVAVGIMIPPACFSAARLGKKRTGRPASYSEYITCCQPAQPSLAVDVECAQDVTCVSCLYKKGRSSAKMCCAHTNKCIPHISVFLVPITA